MIPKIEREVGGRETAGPDYFNEEFIRYYSECPQETVAAIDDFIGKCRNKYSIREREMILRTLVIATVAHQRNRIISKRERVAEGVPYIHHPLEIASRLVDDGFDWLCISAALLHDVPEDSNLRDDLSDKNQWLDFIKNEFNAQGDYRAGDLLSELVFGVTEPEESEFSREELIRIKDTPVFSAFLSYLYKGGLSNPEALKQEISQEEINKLVLVIARLNHLFECALQSPEHLRIFIVKIADIWQNYKTITEVSKRKVLRGRIAAGLAEWMGWYGMRSDIIERLSSITDTASPFSPDLSGKMVASASLIDRVMSDTRSVAAEISGALTGLSPQAAVSADCGWPCIDACDLKYLHRQRNLYLDSDGPYSLPVPQITIQLDDIARFRDYPIHPDYPKTTCLFSSNGKRSFQLQRLQTQQAIARRLLGRLRTDARLIEIHPVRKKLGICSIEDGSKPYVIDLFSRDRAVEPSDVPELGLFNHMLRVDPKRWDYHKNMLMAFIYDLNMPFRIGGRSALVYLVVWEGNFLFVNGKITYNEIGHILGEDFHELEVVKGGKRQSVSAYRRIINEFSSRWYRNILGSRFLEVPKSD